MPRYFFDIHDGDNFTRDDVGQECEDRQELRDQAVAVLPNIARDELPDGDRRVFWVKVRDEQNRYIFHASLSLIADWLDEGAAPAENTAATVPSGTVAPA